MKIGFGSRLQVTEYRPVQRLMMFTALAVVIVAAGIAGHYLGRTQTEQKLMEAADLERSNTKARERIRELERALADRELGATVDEDAGEQLRATIKELRDQLADRREELRFYRQLMAPSQAQRGLRVERLDLIGPPGSRAVQYRLMLTQVVDRHDWVSGTVTIEVQGQEGDTQRVLSLTELEQTDVYPLAFKFRYFQDFTGTLTLPPMLEPNQVVVTVSTTGRGAKQVQRTFGWTPKEG